jgi:hypothetical protein
MLFDLEDLPPVEGCRDKTALNYDSSATIQCISCCKYPPPFQEATTDGKTPMTEDCCLKLNETSDGQMMNGILIWSPWYVKVDVKGVKRCIRGQYYY